MQKEELVNQARRSISVEYFETFDPDTQLDILKRLENTILIVKAAESDFAPAQFEELLSFLENRLNELQIIYNIKTNKTLDDFWDLDV